VVLVELVLLLLQIQLSRRRLILSQHMVVLALVDQVTEWVGRGQSAVNLVVEASQPNISEVSQATLDCSPLSVVAVAEGFPS
jgi:hypothetical protein